jgi:hypothetical protein
MKTFGERPFDLSIHHFQTSFAAVSDEIVARLTLGLPLTLHYVS